MKRPASNKTQTTARSGTHPGPSFTVRPPRSGVPEPIPPKAASKSLRAARPHPGPAPPEGSPAAIAAGTLFDGLYRDVGEPGTLLDHPQGRSFTLKDGLPPGAAHTGRSFLVSVAGGPSVPHHAAVAVELERGGMVYVDVLDAHATLNDLKAHAFDATQVKGRGRKTRSVLVFVRRQAPVVSPALFDALGAAYDYTFGINEEDVPLGPKFAACRAEIVRLMRSVGG